MTIRGILITAIAPFENHMANCGEKLLGNASSIKRRPDERVYVSGQMQRHVLFSAIDRINQWEKDESKKNKNEDSVGCATYVSNGDGVSNMIETDIRADLGGFMHTVEGQKADRRTAPVSVTPAVAKAPSRVGRDLLTRVKMNEEGKEQAIATREYSQSDEMLMNYFLDVTSVGTSKAFVYERDFHISTKYIKHINDTEKLRRVKLFIEATKMMNDYANQARNAVCGEPQKVLIVFDPALSRKACRYFSANENEKKNILNELNDRGAIFFLGDDVNGGGWSEDENNKNKPMSVYQAYSEAFKFLDKLIDSEKNTENELCNLAGDDKGIKSYKEAFGL